jgi:hypothetical protein
MQDIVSNLEHTAEVSKANRVQAEGVHWTAKSLEQVAQRFDNGLELFRVCGAFSQPTAPLVPTSAVPALTAGAQPAMV